MANQKEVCILIPTLNPDEKLPRYIMKLIESGFENIIIVNDGSDSRSHHIFEEIERIKDRNDNINCNIYILNHAVNLGKGRALKNGINYYLVHLRDKYPKCKGIITVDSDGQHLTEDVSKVSSILENGKSDVVWGCRDFSAEQTPPKSRFGNRMTRATIRILFGAKISDTQTGLRGFSNSVLDSIIGLYGERFEYETNVLIECIKKRQPIEEVPIHTIYKDNNSATHFRPVVDSLKIYSLIFRQFLNYIIVSLSSFALDCTLFWLLCRIVPRTDNVISTGGIWAATAGARCLSSLYNYYMNKYIVFGHKEKEFRTLAKYFLLCIAIMLASASFVSVIYSALGVNEVLIKCLVDTLLFFVSYIAQDRFIFANR